MDNLGKYFFYRHLYTDSYYKDERVNRRLYRLNRESKSYYYSDVQRSVKNYDVKPIIYDYFKDVAHQFKKDKYFDESGNVKKRDNDNIFFDTLEKSIQKEMISDTPFSQMFRVLDWKDDYVENYMEYKKDPIFPCYDYGKIKNPDESFFKFYCGDKIIKHMEELFSRKVYVVERMEYIDNYGQERGGFVSCNRLRDKYDRNSIFYQYTLNGGDKLEITGEENDGNATIYFWLFEDRVVIREAEGQGTW